MPGSGSNHDEIPVLPPHCNSIKRWESGRNAREAGGLLGELNSFQRFVKGFGKIAYRSDKNYGIVSVSFKKSETVAMKFEMDYPWK